MPTHTPVLSKRPITLPRDIHENARDVARSFAGTETRSRDVSAKMRFAHLKRILKLGRLRLRGPRGAHDEFVLAAIAHNLRRLVALVARPPLAQVLCIANAHSVDAGFFVP
jgi:hypothetical protein